MVESGVLADNIILYLPFSTILYTSSHKIAVHAVGDY